MNIFICIGNAWSKLTGIGAAKSPRDHATSDDVSYRIYAMNQTAINNAKRELDNLCKAEIKRHVFHGEEEQKLISSMNEEHVRVHTTSMQSNPITLFWNLKINFIWNVIQISAFFSDPLSHKLLVFSFVLWKKLKLILLL